MKKRYETPDFRVIGLAEEDILTLSVGENAKDADVDNLDYDRITW